MGWVEHWTAAAACLDMDPDELHVTGAAQTEAKAVCFDCPVRFECLACGLDGRESGVWGGMTERERRALLRRYPDATSWRPILESAKDSYERNYGVMLHSAVTA